jgi:hypothetical protein
MGETMTEMSSESRVLEMLNRIKAERNLALPVLAAMISTSPKSMGDRLLGKTKVTIGEFSTLAHKLQIAPDAVLRALLPELPEPQSTIIELRKAMMTINKLEKQLRAAQTAEPSTDLELVTEIVNSDHWAVSVLPVKGGPTSNTRVLQGVRLAVTPVDPDATAGDETARSMFVAEFSNRLLDRGFFLADTANPLPKPPIHTPPENVVYLQLPAYAQDRPPMADPVQFPKLGGGVESVVIMATTQTVWCNIISAIVARNLGWGLENTATRGRATAPVEDRDRDLYIEESNRIRNEGLSRVLTKPPSTTVAHYNGRPGVEATDTREDHPLVAIANSENANKMPFVVVIRESDRVMRRQAQKVRRSDTGAPKFTEETWCGWRDDLVTSATALERTRRGMVVDFEFAWELQDEADSAPSDTAIYNSLMWKGCVEIAWKVLDRLREWGALRDQKQPRSRDAVTKKILDTRNPYS